MKQIWLYCRVEHKMYLDFEIKTGDKKKIVSSVLDVSGLAASAVAPSGLRLHTPAHCLLFSACCWGWSGWKFKKHYSSPGLLKMWFSDQQHQYHLGAYLNC